MSKKTVKENLSTNLNTDKCWEEAIYDAERRIQQARKQIRRLRGAIVVFKDRRDAGEPWPGTAPTVEKADVERGI